MTTQPIRIAHPLQPVQTTRFDADMARHLATTSAWFAEHPIRPAEPSQEDYEHPTRASMCQGGRSYGHEYCGGIYATPTGDADCTCPCHDTEGTR